MSTNQYTTAFAGDKALANQKLQQSRLDAQAGYPVSKLKNNTSFKPL